MGKLYVSKARVVFAASHADNGCPRINVPTASKNAVFRDDYRGQVKASKKLIKSIFK